MSLENAAPETVQWLNDGRFENSQGETIQFKYELENAIKGSSVYTPEKLQDLVHQEGKGESQTKVSVTNETTQIAARRLVVEEGIHDLVLLNFASARNPDGGFISGAKAQEEDLSRCSGLYKCLLPQELYYEVNRSQSSMLYTDHMIYSPNVPWFRTRSRDKPEELFLASVITAPAPNAVLPRVFPQAFPTSPVANSSELK